MKLKNRTKFPPFPMQVEVEEIRDIHGDLSDYDSIVGPLLLDFINGKKVWRFDRNQRLGKSIKSLTNRFPRYLELLSKYERIYDELQELIDTATNVSRDE